MFTPSHWADPTFLTFVKEYWEFNFKEKYKHVTVTVVFYIAPDDAEVLQDILVYFEVAGGQVVPRLLLGKKMSKMNNAIFFAGKPPTWRTVAQTGSVESLQGRAVLPDDTFKAVKGEMAKTFLAIGNRVADRMAQGARPSLDVHNSVRYDEPSPVGLQGLTPPGTAPARAAQSRKSAFEKLEESVDTNFMIGGIEVGSRKLVIKLTYEQELKTLREFGPKNMDKYWKKVEEKPIKDMYMSETDPLKLPMQLFAVPDLRSDLLSFREKGVDGSGDYNLIAQYLTEKLNAATAALEAAG